jgi:ABC-type multidrug transport system fused ATPase/permease subunit
MHEHDVMTRTRPPRKFRDCETWPSAVLEIEFRPRLPAGLATNPGPTTAPRARPAGTLVCLPPPPAKPNSPANLTAASRREAPTIPMAPTVEINHLTFTYPGIDGRPPPGAPPLIEDVCFSLDAGQRCLLLGSNGAGKLLLITLW